MANIACRFANVFLDQQQEMSQYPVASNGYRAEQCRVYLKRGLIIAVDNRARVAMETIGAWLFLFRELN